MVGTRRSRLETWCPQCVRWEQAYRLLRDRWQLEDDVRSDVEALAASLAVSPSRFASQLLRDALRAVQDARRPT